MVQLAEQRLERLIRQAQLKVVSSTGSFQQPQLALSGGVQAKSESQPERNLDLKELQRARAKREKRAALRLERQLQEMAEASQRQQQ